MAESVTSGRDRPDRVLRRVAERPFHGAADGAQRIGRVLSGMVEPAGDAHLCSSHACAPGATRRGRPCERAPRRPVRGRAPASTSRRRRGSSGPAPAGRRRRGWRVRPGRRAAVAHRSRVLRWVRGPVMSAPFSRGEGARWRGRGTRRNLASSTSAPSGETTTGLQSSSATSSIFSREQPDPADQIGQRLDVDRVANSGTRTATVTRGATAASGRRRRRGAVGSASAVSRCSSAANPPMPKRTSGPKAGSWWIPTMTSTPGGTIGCTIAPPMRGAERSAHLGEGAADGAAAREPEPHPADIGLVHQLRRRGLQRDREPELAGTCHRLAVPSRRARSVRPGSRSPPTARESLRGRTHRPSGAALSASATRARARRCRPSHSRRHPRAAGATRRARPRGTARAPRTPDR